MTTISLSNNIESFLDNNIKDISNNINNKDTLLENNNNNIDINSSSSSSSLKRNRSLENFNEAGNFTLEKQIRRETFPFPVHTYTGISIAGSRGGERPNQDNMFMFEDRETRTLVLGCLDGHGEYGHQISLFFKNGIEERLFRHPLMNTQPSVATEEVIKRLEFEARCRRDMDTRFSGTTLAMVIIKETKVISINIGDSRIVLGTRDETGQIVARPLSRDHKPDDIHELSRIIQLGGRVYRTVSSSSSSSSHLSSPPKGKKKKVWGPVRVWLKDMDAPGLAMSRSLCDDIIHTAGVVSLLDIYEHTFNHSNDCVLIVGTDGMWQYVSNQEAVEMAIKEREPSRASVSLVKEGRKRYLQKEKSIDDTTVCIAFLRGIELKE